MVEKMRDIPGILADFGSVRRGVDARLSAVASRDFDVSGHLHVAQGGDPAALDSGPSVFIDASASINPLGPSDWIVPLPSYGEYRRSAALVGCKITVTSLGPAPDFALDWDELDDVLGYSATRQRCMQTALDAYDELGAPDVIVMLGTKDTVGDLEHLRRTGLDIAVLQAQARGVEVIGICGGLQMLGDWIEDPEGVETAQKQVQGLGLLPLRTRFCGSKQLRQCRARHLPSGVEILGYEIHHGVTDFSNVTSLFIDADGRVLGGGQPARRVWGTYIHGLFDSDAFRREFLDALRLRKGLLPLGESRNVYSLEPSLNRLAKAFREHVDYDAICHLMGLT
jgi:hypothetical protein